MGFSFVAHNGPDWIHQQQREADDGVMSDAPASEAALRAYFSQHQRREQHQPGERLIQHLARARLQAAREKANREKKLFRPQAPLTWHWQQQAAFPFETESDSVRSSRPGSRIAGPIARSWALEASVHSQQQRQVLQDPVSSLNDVLLHQRSLILGDSSLTRFSRKIPRLLDYCLLRLVFDLSTLEGGNQSVLGYVEALSWIPVHLKQRCMQLGQVAAPLSLEAARALLQSSIDSSNTSLPATAWDDDTLALAPEDTFTEVHLAFSPLNMLQLRSLIHLTCLQSLTFLNLSHTPNFALSHSLLSVLATLPNLSHLSLGGKDLNAAIITPQSFVSKLAVSTPLLQWLDLSYSHWLDQSTLEAVDISERWRFLKHLILKETPVLHETQKSSPVSDMKSNPRAGCIASNRGILDNNPSLAHEKLADRKHSVERMLVSRRRGDGSARPWIEVDL